MSFPQINVLLDCTFDSALEEEKENKIKESQKQIQTRDDLVRNRIEKNDEIDY